MAVARSLSGTASGFWAHLAISMALYGGPRDEIRTIVSRTADAADSPGMVPRFRAAAALGLVGFQAEAMEMVRLAAERYPESTLVRTVFVPTATAAAALGRGEPAAAVTALEPARPSELGTVAGLLPSLLRGDALLAAGDPLLARAEYERILANRGADPFSLAIPLAHLGLGRALALAGDAGRSRAEYDELFRIWSEADEGLPLVRRARAEQQRLETTPPPAPAGR
jgi:tetratricopeptide (TPR) repeat protein